MIQNKNETVIFFASITLMLISCGSICTPLFRSSLEHPERCEVQCTSDRLFADSRNLVCHCPILKQENIGIIIFALKTKAYTKNRKQ